MRARVCVCVIKRERGGVEGEGWVGGFGAVGVSRGLHTARFPSLHLRWISGLLAAIHCLDSTCTHARTHALCHDSFLLYPAVIAAFPRLK